MGLNFRGSANRFNYKNQNSFQDKSAPGPRRGVGGDQPGSLARAEKRFAKLHSQNKGYISSTPITRKSSSPLKINATLVAGAADVNKKFTDIGAAVADGFKILEPEPTAANLGNYTYPEVTDGNNGKGKGEDEEETTGETTKTDKDE